MSELKPCPHCDGKSAVVNFMPGKPDGYWQGVCRKCGMRTKYHQTRQDAISAMNRRAQPDNAPLTLEELRGMEGEPVWVEVLGDKAWWIVIRSAERGKLTTDYGGWFDFKDYGKTWLAYRRKPEPEGGDPHATR